MAYQPRTEMLLAINGYQVQIKEPDPKMKLADFLRNWMDLKGTKLMCNDGGCGVCTVLISQKDPASDPSSVMAVNSCLVSLVSMHGWYITTIEHLASDSNGLSGLQASMIKNNGIQCGYCTPGFIMKGLSCLIENKSEVSNNPHPLFAGNICRCTGYRPIMDAMKESAQCVDVKDIEDIFCPRQARRGHRKVKCFDHRLVVKDGTQWYQPSTMVDLLDLLARHENESVHIQAGNTMSGIYNEAIDAKCIVNISQVDELRTTKVNADYIMFGASVTLSEMITTLSTKYEMSPLVDHLQKIGSKAVRNVATWSGNMMMLHRYPEFPSDIFILLEMSNATLTVADFQGNREEYSPMEFLSLNMTNKMLISVQMKVFASDDCTKTFKVMPRQQGCYAYVNAAFKARVDEETMTLKTKPLLVFGALGDYPIRATKTEDYLEKLKEQGRRLDTNETLQDCISILETEIKPKETKTGPSQSYRKQVAINLFYKFYLGLVGDRIQERLKSAPEPSSSPGQFTAKQNYSTVKENYPLTKPIHRRESKLQASGRLLFTNDLPTMKDEVYAAFVLAGSAPATFIGLDTTEAEELPGFVDVITYKDIPGANCICTEVMGIGHDQILCDGPVKYAGQAVALVVADSQCHADEIAGKVKVLLKDKGRPITSIRNAIDLGSYHNEEADSLIIGNTSDAFESCAHIISGEIETKSMHHYYLEPQTCVVIPQDKRIEVYSATQFASCVQQGVSETLGIPAHTVSVTGKQCGGGFGGKTRASIQVAAATAVAAYTLKRPVRIAMDYKTNMKLTGNRAPILAEYKVGITADGLLQAIDLQMYLDAGYLHRCVDGPVAMHNVDNAYYCPNWTIRLRSCKTTTAPNTHLRGPGNTQARFIIECIMDHVASYLGIESEGIRMRNLYKIGQRLEPFMFDWIDPSILENIWNEVVTSSNFKERENVVKVFNQNNRWKKRGIAMMPLLYRHGYYNFHFTTLMHILYSDGSVVVCHGGTEMGQGINTRVTQVAAKCLGIPLDYVSVEATSTKGAPNSAETGGSVTSEQVCLSVLRCCEILNERLQTWKDKYPHLDWKQLIALCEKERVELSAVHMFTDKEKEKPFYAVYGAACSEVEVDLLTGETVCRRADLLMDCGQSVNPSIDLGQVEGAFVMGIGQFMKERIVYDPETGAEVSLGTWDYHPPLADDIPRDFRVELAKGIRNSVNPLGSKGVGEPGVCMAVSCVLATRRAVAAGCQEVGHQAHVHLDSPATIDCIQQLTCWSPGSLTLA